MKISYKDFKACLEIDGYSAGEIDHLFNAVKSMDSTSRAWVIRWLNKGMLPDDEIEGVTAAYLIEELKYKPINAFIVLDWLKTDPEAAKYHILKITSPIPPSESVGREMAKYIDEARALSAAESINTQEPLTD